MKSLLKSPLKWMIPLIVLALGLTGYGIFLALRPASESSDPTASPSPTTDAPAISALGRLEPAGTVIRMAAPSTSFGSGRILALRVKEGEPVKKNQVLAVMDDYESLRAQAQTAQMEVVEAQARLAQARTGAKQAEVAAQQDQVAARLERARAKEAEKKRREFELRNAQAEYERFKQLFEEGAISRSDFERQELAFATAQAALVQTDRELAQAVQELREAQKQAASLRSVRPVDVQQAQAAVQVAIAKFNRAKAELDKTVVRSPIDGQVLKIYAFPGESVGEDGIMDLGRTQQMYAIAEVYETDVSRVQVGQRAQITSPAFEEPIDGVVDHVGLKIQKNDVLNTDPAADTDVRVVEVKIRLEDSAKVAGLTNLKVNVEIFR